MMPSLSQNVKEGTENAVQKYNYEIAFFLKGCGECRCDIGMYRQFSGVYLSATLFTFHDQDLTFHLLAKQKGQYFISDKHQD